MKPGGTKRFQSQKCENSTSAPYEELDLVDSNSFSEKREFLNMEEAKKSEFYQQHFGIITQPKAKQMIDKVKKPEIVLLPAENQDKPENGSLFNLFSSEYFTLSMLMQYYFKKFTNSGINAFLTNKLYQIRNEELEFYIPQLVYLLIKQHSYPLEKLFSKKSSENISMFFLVPIPLHIPILDKLVFLGILRLRQEGQKENGEARQNR